MIVRFTGKFMSSHLENDVVRYLQERGIRGGSWVCHCHDIINELYHVAIESTYSEITQTYKLVLTGREPTPDNRVEHIGGLTSNANYVYKWSTGSNLKPPVEKSDTEEQIKLKPSQKLKTIKVSRISKKAKPKSVAKPKTPRKPKSK